jgi:hypothetical protein
MQSPQLLANLEWVKSEHGSRLLELSENMLADWWRRHNEVPDYLYHYTHAEGLLGILRTQTFRATHALYLNDPTELMHAHELIKEEVGPRIKRERDPIIKDLLRRVYHAIDPSVGSQHYFLTCFCRAGDRLSQWRAYTDRGGGYALGISAPQVLYMTKESPDLALRRVIYDHDQQRGLVRTILDRAISLLSDTTNGLTPEQASPTARIFGLFLADHLAEFHFSFKNQAFQEEEEWRVIHMTSIDDNEVGRLQFRALSGHLVPYVEVKLHAEARRLPLEKVMYGPTLRRERTERSLQWLLKKHGYPHASVEGSIVPLQ